MIFLAELQNNFIKYERNMEQSKEEFNKPFQYEEELKVKLKRQFELNTELDMDKGGDDVLADDDSMKDPISTEKDIEENSQEL